MKVMEKSLKTLLSSLYHNFMSLYDSQHMIKYWRNKGAKIGDHVNIYHSNIDRGHIYLLQIGNNVTITNSAIFTHDASMHGWVGKSKIAPVNIGSNVFIGYNSIVMPGVTIGDNVIIGANSLVIHDVPSNSVAIGSPARVVKSLTAHMDSVRADMEKHPVFDTYWRNKSNEQIDAIKEQVAAFGRGYDE